MKRIAVSVLSLIIVLAAVFGLSSCSCSDGGSGGGDKLTVIFMVDGEEYTSMKVERNKEITLPAEPTKSGYTFDGWYFDEDIWLSPFKNDSLIGRVFSNDLYVYAKWSHAHTESDRIEDREASCSSIGIWHTECTVCKEVMQSGITEMNDRHIPVTDPRVEPTYTSTGLTEGSHCSECGEVLAKQEIIPTLIGGTDIRSDILTVDNDTVWGTISNATTSFSFIGAIKTAEGAVYTLYSDGDCKNAISDQTVSLGIGANVFYIAVSNGNDSRLYTVTLYRRHMFTVTFDTAGGTPIEPMTVEEGSVIQKPVTTRENYRLIGWDYDFSIPISKNEHITANWKYVMADYRIEYYLQNIYDDGYPRQPELSVGDIAEIGETVTAEKKVFEHFTLDSTLGNPSGEVLEDGSLVLKLYYTRNKYSLSCANPEYGSITNGGEYKYGATVNTKAIYELGYLGYGFLGWYCDRGCLSEEESFSFVIDGDVLAKFGVSEEMADFDFTSTKSTCKITGIKDKTVKEITVPDYVTEIGYAAFAGCSELESITLPFIGSGDGNEGVEDMKVLGYVFGSAEYNGAYAATQKYSSTDSVIYYIPSSLRTVNLIGGSLANGAFSGCTSLSYVSIPESVDTVSLYDFYGCSSLEKISVDAGNEYYKDVDGILYNKSGTKLIKYPAKKADTEFTVPSGVTSYTSYAFHNCDLLRSVTVTGGASRISSYLFLDCDSLTTVNLPSGISAIGSSAFESCNGLESINLPSGMTSIDARAFADCDSLLSVTLPNSITSLGSSVFESCDGLERVIIEDGVKNIGSAMFRDCKSLSSISLADSIETVNSYAFFNCDSIDTLTLPTGIKSIHDYAFSDCDGFKELTLPGSITDMGSWAFSFCDSLEKVAVQSGIQYISDHEFHSCINLTKVTMPSGLTRIGEAAFQGCEVLESIIIASDVERIDAYAFAGCFALSSVTIQSNVSSIGNYAFENCYSLESVYIPQNVDSLGLCVFRGCASLASIEVESGNLSYKSIEGNLYTKQGSLLTYAVGKDNSHFTVPKGVTHISDYAFYGCTTLEEVTVPKTVTSIGSYAFSRCESLGIINYYGTEDEWNSIQKGTDWDSNITSYTVIYNYKGDDN